MSNLSPAAREIIAGRHADPFCYPHTENNEPVLRVFLPDARRMVVSVRGELELARIDDAGLFAGPFDDPHYRLRAQFGPSTPTAIVIIITAVAEHIGMQPQGLAAQPWTDGTRPLPQSIAIYLAKAHTGMGARKNGSDTVATTGPRACRSACCSRRLVSRRRRADITGNELPPMPPPRPPIMRASLRVMARPSPVPP
jgi:hypothetical protein